MKPIVCLHVIHKICLALFLSFAVWSCQSTQYNQKVNDLAREANNLLEQEEAIRSEWKIEFGQFFNPESRAKFPSNREELRPHAENQIRLLEQMEALSNSAVDKFEQASSISNNEKERRYTALIAASLKKGVESYPLFKEQMKLVLDNEIKDSQTFEAKLSDLTQRIAIKTKESAELQAEAGIIIGRQAR
jgi:hypothetical protein